MFIQYSGDGVLDPAEIVRIAHKRGLDGVAITDRNTIRGGEEAKKDEAKDFKVILDTEVMTEKGEITRLFPLQRGQVKAFSGRYQRD